MKTHTKTAASALAALLSLGAVTSALAQTTTDPASAVQRPAEGARTGDQPRQRDGGQAGSSGIGGKARARSAGQAADMSNTGAPSGGTGGTTGQGGGGTGQAPNGTGGTGGGKTR